MIVTRYPRPPNQHQQYPGLPPPPGPYHTAPLPPPPPPPAVAPYTQQSWAGTPSHATSPSVHPPQPASYVPPPAPNQYTVPPPHPHQPSYSGYSQQPGPNYLPPPPPPPQSFPPPPPAPSPAHVAAAGQGYPPPPPPTAHPSWNAPQPQYPPQLAYSPSPTVASYHIPAATRTPAQPSASVPPPEPAPTPSVKTVIKDRSDPTFYDGWDDEEFEYASAFWIPPKGDTSHEALSIGQYIWHSAVPVSRAVSIDIDDLVSVATPQRSDQKTPVIPSKYFETFEDEGYEYVLTFQRIKDVDAWEERKDDPLFKVFTDVELHEDVVPTDEVFRQVLSRPKADDRKDIMDKLIANLGAYLNGTKGGIGKNVETENILASLGVTGTAKPVFATPFPAYNPPPEEPTKSRPSGGSTHTRRERSAMLSHRGSFNPFKTTSNSSRHSSSRSNSYPHYPPPPAPQSSLYPRSSSNSYQSSPMDRSPSHNQPTPPSTAHYPPQLPTIIPSSHHSQPPPHRPNSGFASGQHPLGHWSHNSPSRDYRHSNTESPYDDPWNLHNGRHEGTPAGPGTPIGSDFGDSPTHGHGRSSMPRTPVESHNQRKRPLEDPESQHRKRSKPLVDSAYERRW
ncbi:hypothetical protein, variant [Verruconis gallopava]|nr:hypothetical protein, variant [Verruconis gallopava]KIW00473.1 hypothetical protein, variant [Verruconis gallopava]